jgi:hypothetical protein
VLPISQEEHGTVQFRGGRFDSFHFRKDDPMYTLLVRLMLIAAMLELGLSLTALRDPRKMEIATMKVLIIQWKPISIFPEETKRFQ